MMDRLDKLSIVFIIVLSVLATGMVVKKAVDDKKSHNIQAAVSPQPGPDQQIYEEVKSLIKVANYDDALKKLQIIREKHPQRLESQIYLAKIYEGQGNMEQAILLCRKSVEKNPELVDMASNNLWDMVQKGLAKLKREKKLKPNDKKVARLLRDLYFCQRRLGQGCE